MEKIYLFLASITIVCAVVFYFVYRTKQKALKILRRDHSYKEKKLVFSYIRDLYGCRFFAFGLVFILGEALGWNIAHQGFFSLTDLWVLIATVLCIVLVSYAHFTYRKLVDLC